MSLIPPPLRNSCFALPAGVDWLHCDEALTRLDAALSVITGTKTQTLDHLMGKILARDVIAQRPHPPATNSAVDGYALRAADAIDGPNIMNLANGRAAAGVPFDGTLQPSQALRILTGALVPQCADSVILQEDVALEGGKIAFHGPIKRGANTRPAAEDIETGSRLLLKGHRLRAGDLSLLSAAGLDCTEVYTPLKIGVMATGDEIRPPGKADHAREINDANSAMLIAWARTWGMKVEFLGIISDDRDHVRNAFEAAKHQVDVVIATGGASAGEEDHVSSLMREEGHVTAWRIAVKPGRPLILGQWGTMPVFGLPGNPVAAFVCMLVFLRPALRKLAGGTPTPPQGFMVPAGFSKNKKEGRSEYLRARIHNGAAEIFPSEGSGRVTSISWAEGLVHLNHPACTINAGDLVHYIPFGSFD